MPFGLPAPGQVGGPWGGSMFPPEFEQEAIRQGWDMLQAANAFLEIIRQSPADANGQPIDFGWYWNSFLPGRQNEGQSFNANDHNLTYNGQTVPNQPPQPPPDQAPPPPTPQQPAPPTQNGGAGPRPTAPPPGVTGPGRWALVSGQNGMRWEWRSGEAGPQQPPAPTPPTTPPPPAPGPPDSPAQPQGSGAPVISYPPRPQSPPPPAAPQAPAPMAQERPFPLGGGQAAPVAPAPQQLAQGTNRQTPPTTPQAPQKPVKPSGQGVGTFSGGGGSTGPVGPPQTTSQMRARQWNRPGGLLR